MAGQTNTPKFHWREFRQVNVHDIPGVRYIPCVPVLGASHGVTRIENGTFIMYIGDIDGGPRGEDKAWIFSLTEKPEIEFVVPAACAPYLWKAKQQIKPGMRRR
jgi:hypothetical protein